MLAPKVGRSSFAASATKALISVSFDCNGCLRETPAAGRSVPRRDRRPRRSASQRVRGQAVGDRVRQDIDVPVMTVSMLLKSCATPAVSWPTASISRLPQLFLGGEFFGDVPGKTDLNT